MDQALKFVLNLIAVGGGAAAFAYFIFRYLGSKWIENKFAKQLANHKHAKDVDIQRLRIEIDSLLSGALKLQEREFELLPEAWEKLDEAYGLTRWAMSPLQEFADVDRMTGDQLDEFLAKSELSETQKQDVRSSSNKGRIFQELSYWHRTPGKSKTSALRY